MASAVLPGLGHLLAGSVGQGLARSFLFVVWLGGAVMLAGAGGGQAVPVAGPMALGAAILWAATLVDLARLRAARPALLTARELLWLVVGVVVLSVAGLAVSLGRLLS